MILRVHRYDATPTQTIGRLMIDGQFVAFTCEDPMRVGPKVDHETAIPAGRYAVGITMSQRFGRMMPLLREVPGFAGIRIHGGNTAADTSGCLLVGMTRTVETIGNCRPALDAVQHAIAGALANGEAVWIIIEDPVPEGTLRA